MTGHLHSMVRFLVTQRCQRFYFLSLTQKSIWKKVIIACITDLQNRDSFHIYRGLTDQCWLAFRISALGKEEWGVLAKQVWPREPLPGPNTPQKRTMHLKTKVNDASRMADSISRETELLTAAPLLQLWLQ